MLVAVWGVSAPAQNLSGRAITAVNIQGLERVSEQLVRSKVEVKPGDAYNARAIARDIRRLYELGYFSIIKADAAESGDGVAITYIIEEKRRIDEIKIVGNKKIRDRNIRAVLSWREGDAFVAEGYDEERDAILNLYQSKGYPNAHVDIVVEETGPSRVRLTYDIEEGRKARIHRIEFAGNEALSDRQLKKAIKTRRSWWFIGGRYKEEQFEEDLQRILDKYGDVGRLEAAITRSDFDYLNNGKKLDITLQIQEGAEYSVGSLEIADNYVFDTDEIERLLKVKENDVHNKSQVKADADLVTKGYSDSGYVRAAVTPQVTLDREAKKTHIVHRIDEGDLKYVREVRITGNAVTRDDVIRREILTVPGERFDGTLLEASERRLDALDFFDNVRFNLDDVQEDDRYSNLLIDVEEGKTSYWNFGMGYSTEEAFNVYSELRFRNFDVKNPPTFSGGGQQFQIRTSLGQRRTEYSLAFTDPEFLGRPLAFGFDIFDESYEYSGGTDYTEDTQGVQIRLGKILSPHLTARTALRYRNLDITDSEWEQFSIYEQLRGGDTTVSSIWGLNRNTVDSKRDPSKGSVHDIELEIAGLAGDNSFYKIQHDSTWYWPLGEKQKWVLSYRTREGYAAGFGDTSDVPLADRFFVGGSTTVRGYRHRDIGPQAPRYSIMGFPLPFIGDDVRIGGEIRLVNNLEIKYKLTDIFRLYAFTDAGGAWLDTSDFGGDIKASVGIGFGVDIPKIGPIRVDYGYPLNPDEDQGSGRLHLMTGFRF